MDLDNAAKFGLRAGLSTAVVITKAAKYGAHFSFGITKGLLNGVSSMAGHFSGGAIKIGIGDFLFNETTNRVDKTFDKLIGFEKYLKEKSR